MLGDQSVTLATTWRLSPGVSIEDVCANLAEAIPGAVPDPNDQSSEGASLVGFEFVASAAVPPTGTPLCEQCDPEGCIVVERNGGTPCACRFDDDGKLVGSGCFHHHPPVLREALRQIATANTGNNGGFMRHIAEQALAAVPPTGTEPVWPDQSAQHAVLLGQIKDAYAEGKADAVALIRERAANALPEVARFTLDEIEAIVALAAPPSGAEAGEARQEHPQFCSTPDCGLRATTVKQLDAVRWGPVCDDCAAVPPTGTDTDLFADLVDLARAHHGIAVPPSGAAEAGEGCRAPHCWSEYGTPCGTCPVVSGAEAGENPYCHGKGVVFEKAEQDKWLAWNEGFAAAVAMLREPDEEFVAAVEWGMRCSQPETRSRLAAVASVLERRAGGET